jgi:hypothetical protein
MTKTDTRFGLDVKDALLKKMSTTVDPDDKEAVLQFIKNFYTQYNE